MEPAFDGKDARLDCWMRGCGPSVALWCLALPPGCPLPRSRERSVGREGRGDPARPRPCASDALKPLGPGTKTQSDVLERSNLGKPVPSQLLFCLLPCLLSLILTCPVPTPQRASSPAPASNLLPCFPVHPPTCCSSPHKPARQSQECKTAPLPGIREMCISPCPKEISDLGVLRGSPSLAFPSFRGCTHHWIRGSSYLVPDMSWG